MPSIRAPASRAEPGAAHRHASRMRRTAADAKISLASLRSVGRKEPLARREFAAIVKAGLVFASALRLEGDAGVAGGGEERCVLARHLIAIPKRLSTRRAAWIQDIRRFAHAYTLDVVGVASMRSERGNM